MLELEVMGFMIDRSLLAILISPRPDFIIVSNRDDHNGGYQHLTQHGARDILGLRGGHPWLWRADTMIACIDYVCVYDMNFGRASSGSVYLCARVPAT